MGAAVGGRRASTERYITTRSAPGRNAIIQAFSESVSITALGLYGVHRLIKRTKTVIVPTGLVERTVCVKSWHIHFIYLLLFRFLLQRS
jgi:hypothetical protein